MWKQITNASFNCYKKIKTLSIEEIYVEYIPSNPGLEDVAVYGITVNDVNEIDIHEHEAKKELVKAINSFFNSEIVY